MTMLAHVNAVCERTTSEERCRRQTSDRQRHTMSCWNELNRSNQKIRAWFAHRQARLDGGAVAFREHLFAQHLVRPPHSQSACQQSCTVNILWP